MRVLAYCKRLGVVLAGVFLCTSLGLSSVASGVVIGTQGVANPGFNAAGRGLNRGPVLPALTRLGLANMGPAPSASTLPVSPVARPPVINPLVNPPVANPAAVDPLATAPALPF